MTKPLREAGEATRTRENAQEGEISILITTPEEIHELNKQYRGMDKTTDVLSFPAPEFPPRQIGDVALNFELAQKQAKIRKVRPIDEAAMLAVHGVLHLLGYEDETESERAQMQSRMNEVMKICGLPTEDNWTSLPYPEESTL